MLRQRLSTFFNNMKYKWSLFNFVVNDENKTLIKNTLTGAIVKIDRNIYKNIDCFIKNKTSSLEPQELEIFNALLQQEIILFHNTDEVNNYINLLDDYVQNGDELLSIVIATTYSCNFDCPYCFESGINRNMHFKDRDVDYIYNYVINYLEKKPYIKRATISLFGGEPTLNWKFSEKILTKLNKLFTEKDISFSVGITTNGYLLDDKKANLLYKNKWKTAEITLDGPKKVHDKLRFLLNGKPTFDTIYKNIKNILEKRYLESINLRINVSESNYEYIEELLKKIKNDFCTDQINISIGLITDTLKESDAHKFISNIKFTEDDWANRYLNLYYLLNDLGFKTTDFYTLDGYCLAKQKNGLIFCPDQKIYRCLSMIGRENFAEDNIKTPTYNVNSYLNYNLIKQCLNKKCPLVPVCLAGCSFEALLKYGSINNIFCRKKLYTSINREILRGMYKNA